MNYLKKNKGITLIALIVTIVVLLILAGVTISQITGSESAMEKATQAREENKLGEEYEQIKLCVVNAMSQGLDGKVSESDLRTALNGIVVQTEIEKITGTGPWIIQGNSGREYKITNGGLVNAIHTIDKAIISPISVEERSKVPIVISNGDHIEEIKSCTIADTSIATVAKDTDGIWKITGGTLLGDELQLTTTMTIEGKSGNKIENISITVLKVTTAKDIIPVPTSSATSAYVKYAMNGQTEDNAELCKVLYNDDTFGLQIITVNPVRSVTLGKNDPKISDISSETFEKAIVSYNKAIETLNEYALDFQNRTDNSLALDSRCVGSLPTLNTDKNRFSEKNIAKKSDGTDVTTINYSGNTGNYKNKVNNKGRDEDDNYTILGNDQTKLNAIEATGFSEKKYGDYYWLASRWIYERTSYTYFYVRNVSYIGDLGGMDLCGFNNGNESKTERSAGLRPVFLINPTAKIKNGTGTEQDPYILESSE